MQEKALHTEASLLRFKDLNLAFKLKAELVIYGT